MPPRRHLKYLNTVLPRRRRPHSRVSFKNCNWVGMGSSTVTLTLHDTVIHCSSEVNACPLRGLRCGGAGASRIQSSQRPHGSQLVPDKYHCIEEPFYEYRVVTVSILTAEVWRQATREEAKDSSFREAQRYRGVVGLAGGHGDGESVEQAGGDALGDGGISSNGWKAIWQNVEWSVGLAGCHGDGESVEQAGGDALGDGGISSNGWKAIWQNVEWSLIK
ncbi:hypothetical protein BHE74_00049331 [Ensete ventricosum]|nr:hypothetical protein BHE74_00049331 [Ensete ventricosum]